MSTVTKFADMKVRTKIATGFGLILTILAISGGVGMHGLSQIDAANANVLQQTRAVNISNVIDFQVATTRSFTWKFAHTGSAAMADQADASLAKANDTATRMASVLVDPARIAKAREIADALTGYARMFARVREAVDQAGAAQRDVLDVEGVRARTALDKLSAAAGRAGNGELLSFADRGIEALMDARLNANKWIASRDVAQAKKAGDTLGVLKTALAAIEPAVRAADTKPLYDEASVAIGKYTEAFGHIVSLTNETDGLIDGAMANEANRIEGAVAFIKKSAADEQAVAQAENQATISDGRWIDGSLTLVGLAIGFAFAWAGGNAIARPIVAITAAMRQLANGDSHVAIPAAMRKDEVGAMAAALQVFKDNRIAADRLAAEQEAERRAKEQRGVRLEALTGTFEKTAGELVGMVSSAATELQATAHTMTDTAGQTTQQATTVAAAAEEASVNVQTVASAAEELAASIGEISRQVAQSAKVAGKAVEDARRTDTVVRALAEGAQKIGEVVGLISNIAGQTNLLALNATIEAARAGDAGKGFAVVASEVKSLATQTAKATDDIGRQIAQIQNATREAVASIEGIGQTIGEVSNIAAAIAAAVEEQGSATQEIARNVQQAAIGTTEVTSTIVGVSSGASSTGAAATQVLGAAEELSRQSERLSGEVGRFIAEVKAA